MAQYRCSLSVTSQYVIPPGGKMPKSGVAGLARRSCVAGASYRSGERLFDQEQGKWCEKNNDRLGEVVYTNILAPTGAPDIVHDRNQLWNAVERSVLKADGTTRKPRQNKTGQMVDGGAQLYRECQLMIPREVWDADRSRAIDMVEEFTQGNFVADGMIADIAIHDSEAADGKRNVHAHVMLTMRRLETDPRRLADGHLFRAKRERDWDCPDKLSKQISLANKKRDGALKQFEETGDPRSEKQAQEWADTRQALDADRPVNRLRRDWERVANQALMDVGSDARIDHRTLKAQREEALREGDLEKAAALDREPLPRLSPIAKHIKQHVGVIADRANSYWASMARRSFWTTAKSMASTNRPERIRLFQRITQVMEGFLQDWRDNRSPRDMVPLVRLEHDERGQDR